MFSQVFEDGPDNRDIGNVFIYQERDYKCEYVTECYVDIPVDKKANIKEGTTRY